MISRTNTAILTFALSMALVSSVVAKDFKISATVCWTGKLNVLGTSYDDTGWSSKSDFTATPDDKASGEILTGQCVGSGGIVNGKRESAPLFCITVAKDGSKAMFRSVGDRNGAKGVYFSGTGRFKGISGTLVAGRTTDRPAPQGSFAGCRQVVGEYTLPD